VEDRGETYRARASRVYLEDRGLNGRPRTAAGSANTPPSRGDRRKARKNGRNPQARETTHQRNQRPGRARGDPRESPSAEHRKGQHWLERVVDSDDRKRRRRAEKAGGQRPRSAVTPQPSNRDHHSRFEKKLTAWNCVEVVVRSKPPKNFFGQSGRNGLYIPWLFPPARLQLAGTQKTDCISIVNISIYITSVASIFCVDYLLSELI